jgi:hypothetical protein
VTLSGNKGAMWTWDAYHNGKTTSWDSTGINPGWTFMLFSRIFFNPTEEQSTKVKISDEQVLEVYDINAGKDDHNDVINGLKMQPFEDKKQLLSSVMRELEGVVKEGGKRLDKKERKELASLLDRHIQVTQSLSAQLRAEENKFDSSSIEEEEQGEQEEECESESSVGEVDDNDGEGTGSRGKRKRDEDYIEEESDNSEEEKKKKAKKQSKKKESQKAS